MQNDEKNFDEQINETLNMFSNKRNINQTSIDVVLKKSFRKLNKY